MIYASVFYNVQLDFFFFFPPGEQCLKIIVVLEIRTQTLKLNSLRSVSQYQKLCDFDQVT